MKSLGTEGRRDGVNEIEASEHIYDFIVFRGPDIKNLRVMETSTTEQHGLTDDPAIEKVNQ